MSVITKGGFSALMMAAGQNRTEVISLLLEAGADTDLQNKVYTCIKSVCIKYVYATYKYTHTYKFSMPMDFSSMPLCSTCKLKSSRLARKNKKRDRNRTKVGLHNYLQPKGAYFYIVAY